MKRCNWLNQNGAQCGQPYGHTFNHSNGTLTSPRDDWHQFISGEPTLRDNLAATMPPCGTVHTDNSTTPRCLWMGAKGRCIYEQGHTIGHREETSRNV